MTASSMGLPSSDILVRMARVYARISCQIRANVRVWLPSLMSLPSMPTNENFSCLPSSTA
ncbi:hypothetical protein DPMN_006174 [Dreissena polymorpha]|uniref:Uncharacterized protein n=1 Tax=Dreissena polymorpha TaxID=45954 RepID=A0A9D4RX58_DREPO|nr:hypothetical protein DPMN_006174 [Dreissena polymorpha]